MNPLPNLSEMQKEEHGLNKQLMSKPISVYTGKPIGQSMAQDVVDFHRKFKINYDGPIRHLPEQLGSFRAARLLEEAREIIDAQAVGDIEGQLDGIVDLIYIALGTAHLMGFTPEVVQEAWDRVHSANMKKELCSPQNPGKYGALGDKQDIVKPAGWVAPDLSDLCKIQ